MDVPKNDERPIFIKYFSALVTRSAKLFSPPNTLSLFALRLVQGPLHSCNPLLTPLVASAPSLSEFCFAF